jgi:hypothetical protein
MEIQAFGYFGLGASNLDDWTTFATLRIPTKSPAYTDPNSPVIPR